MEPQPASDPAAVLADLRAARRRQRIADFDPFEALYRAYLTGIVLVVIVLVLSAVTGDGRLSGPEVGRIRLHGAQVVGLVVALAFAIGLRSGGRGGPLVVEAADVRHVLLAPIDRAIALRGPAIRQLRFLSLLGAGGGAVAGLLAQRRLPESPFGWLVTGTVVGASSAAGGFGLALLASGSHLGRWAAGGLALATLVWSGADIALGTVTSPASLLGQLALWPLVVRPIDLIGILFVIGALAAGLVLVRNTSLEASERRASLVGQIRFAATLQDLRTVIVLRRQLAQELPRQRPWIRLPRAIPKAWWSAGRSPADDGQVRPAPRPRRLPVWRRGWHGILRWPALRYARLAVLGSVAGLALVGVWNGTTPLVVVAGLALYIAGLDATEPLAQEVDHPDRRDEYSLPAGRLHLHQLGPPAVLMVMVALVGLLAAAVVSGGNTRTWEIGAVMCLPAAMAGLAGAAVSVIKGPPPPLAPQQALIPEAAGARAMGRLLWPPIIAVTGAIPVIAARDAFERGRQPVAAVAATEQVVVLLLVGFVAWVRWQEDAHAWWARQMHDIKEASRGGGRQADGAAG